MRDQSSETCDRCKYGRANQADLRALLCYAAPPTPVMVPQPGGLRGIMVRPQVEPGDTCEKFKPKTTS